MVKRNRVKVEIHDEQTKVKVPTGLRMLVRRSCTAVLVNEGFADPAEVTVTFVDDERIHEMNNEFRQIDSATDVLSFPLGENGVFDTNPETGFKMLGDVVISLEHAVAQAQLYEHTLQREVAFLTVHSMLHLLGYDHVNGGLERVRMREKEEEVLTKLGLHRTSSYYLGEDDEI